MMFGFYIIKGKHIRKILDVISSYMEEGVEDVILEEMER